MNARGIKVKRSLCKGVTEKVGGDLANFPLSRRALPERGRGLRPLSPLLK